MAVPKDKQLYERVKKSIYSKYPQHSAYRSGQLVKAYKEAYAKKHGNKDAYEGKKPSKSGLSRWFKEDWRTQEGSKTYRKRGDVFRPTKRVTSKTPTTFKELSKAEVKKAQAEKKRTGRVKKFKKGNGLKRHLPARRKKLIKLLLAL